MNWLWRVAIVVPVSSKSAAEIAARAINSTGPDYDGDAFNLPLSIDGRAPPTHYGLYTSATDGMVSAMAEWLPQIDGAMFWRQDIDGRLVASNASPTLGQKWGWLETLEAAGLQAVRGD